MQSPIPDPNANPEVLAQKVHELIVSYQAALGVSVKGWADLSADQRVHRAALAKAYVRKTSESLGDRGQLDCAIFENADRTQLDLVKLLMESFDC